MADQKLPSAFEQVTNIVLVGHTGSGKSATGNSLLGQNVFTSKKQARGVTLKCKMHKAATSDGLVINVIDTPGLFDLSMSPGYPNNEIISCLTTVKEGIHAVLLVLSVNDRFSVEEESTIHVLNSIFETKVLDYVIVVFTGGDQLEADGQTLDDYLGEHCPDFLKQILGLCGGRKILFDNRTTNADKKAKQLKQLFVHVADVARQTGGIPYTHDMDRSRKLNVSEQPSAADADKNIDLMEIEQPSTSKADKNIVLVNTEQPSDSEAGKAIYMMDRKQPLASKADKNIVLVNTEQPSASKADKTINMMDTEQPAASKVDQNIVLENTEQPSESEAMDTEQPSESEAMDTEQPSALEADKTIYMMDTEQPSASEADKNIVLVNTEQPSALEANEIIFSGKTEQPSASEVDKTIELMDMEQPLASKADKTINLMETKQPSASEANKNIVLENTEQPAALKAEEIIVLGDIEQPLSSEADENIVLMNTEQHSASEAVENKVLVNTEQPPASETVKNIVLVGRTGNGKSATGNTLIGKQVFISEKKATGVTMTCETYTTVTPSGTRINVIDTPGLFDLSVSAEYLSKEIMHCFELAEGGLHVVVLVLSVRTRFTQEELNTLNTLKNLFGDDILDYVLVLFTGGDELQANNQTLDDYLLHGCPKVLKTILSMCGDRTIMFDNKTRDADKKVEQVREFHTLVAKIEERTHGKPFCGHMQFEIKEETERLRQQHKVNEISNEKRITKLEHMLKIMVKKTDEQERMVSMFSENAQRENSNVSKEEKKWNMVKSAIAVPNILATGRCTIL